jgi:hypothetical protein
MSTPQINFGAYLRSVRSKVFDGFGLIRDMILGALLAAATVVFQAYLKLISVDDWSRNKWQWLLSVVVPFAVVILFHISYRIVTAPWHVHQDLSARNSELEQAVNTELAKRARPELTVSFIGSPPGVMLRLQNSSPTPAVGVHVDDIRNGTKVLRFFPSGSLSGGASECIACQILKSGWKGKNDIMELFYEDTTEKALRRKITSDHLLIRVVYSNLDSAAAQRSWALRCHFWYDYTQERLFLEQPILDPV